MAWGRIDDGHWRHRKVAKLKDQLRKPCLATFWLAVSWANDMGTDGHIPMSALRQIDGTTEEADELVRVGLWEKVDGEYSIHDFLHFNLSREQVDELRRQRSDAGRLGAQKRWSDSTSHSTSHSTSPSTPLDGMHGGMDAPYPVPRIPVSPYPALHARDGLSHIDDEAVRFLEGLTGRAIRTAGDKQLAEYDRQIEEHGLAEVINAYRKVAKTMRSTPQARQVVWSALRILEPFASPQDIKKLEQEDRQDEEARARRNRVEATRRRIEELGA